MKLSLEERGWITDQELRQILGGVSPMTIHRYRNDEALRFPKPVKLKSRNLTSYSELMSWIETQRKSSLARYLPTRVK